MLFGDSPSPAFGTQAPTCLILRINIASISRAVLLAMAKECAPAAERAPVFKYRCCIAQRRRNDAGIEIDQVSVVRKAVARRRLGRRHAMRIVARITRHVTVFEVTRMLRETLVSKNAVVFVAPEAQCVDGRAFPSVIGSYVTASK